MPGMAEDPGYLILKGQLPDPRLLKDAKAEAKAPSNDTSPLGFEILGWGENCSALFHKGLDVSSYINFSCVILI
jgi:hypothetical protein